MKVDDAPTTVPMASSSTELLPRGTRRKTDVVYQGLMSCGAVCSTSIRTSVLQVDPQAFANRPAHRNRKCLDAVCFMKRVTG